MTLGTRLRKNREKQRLSQAAVAEQIGVSQTTYHNWEADVSGVRVEYLIKLTQVLSVGIAELLPELASGKPISKPVDEATAKADWVDGEKSLHDLYKDLLGTKDEVIRLLKEENDSLKVRNAQLEELQKKRVVAG